MRTIASEYPDHKELKVIFECPKCKKEFKGGEIVLEPLPANFHVCGSGGWRLGCPHCDYRTFMGFDEKRKLK